MTKNETDEKEIEVETEDQWGNKTDRWLLSVLLSWLGLSNAFLLSWYGSIADVISNFYSVSLLNVNLLSIVCLMIVVVLGFPTIWFIDRVGLGISFMCCGWFNTASAVLRLFSTLSFIDVSNRYPLIMSGQVLAGLAQALAMFTPTKLTGEWFPFEQRVLGNTVAAMGTIIGVFFASLLPPFLDAGGLQMVYHSVIILVVSSIGAICSMIVLRCPTPPKQSEHRGLFLDIKLCFKNVSFVILMIVLGVAIGLYLTIATLMQQILCPYGYENSFAGICGALLIGCGIVTAFIVGIIADKTQNRTGIIRACMTLATLGVIAFTILTTFSNMNIPIAISVAWLGSCGVGMYSVTLELGTTIMVPVSEVVSNGILVISGQFFTILFVFLSQFVGITYVLPNVRNCSSTDVNTSYWNANAIMSGFAVACSVVILVTFSDKYFQKYRNSHLTSDKSTTDEAANTVEESKL